LIWRIEVAVRGEFSDAAGRAAVEDLRDAGLGCIVEGRFVRVFVIEGKLSPESAGRIARELLADPITDVFSITSPVDTGLAAPHLVVEVAKRPGVMDPVEESTLKGLRDMGLGADAVSTARKYVFRGNCGDEDFRRIAAEALANEVVEECHFGHVEPRSRARVEPYRFTRVEVELLAADDSELMKTSKTRGLSLNLAEMRAIKGYFAKQGRNPTDAELETLAQTWSEHCVHKTFRGIINYEGEIIDNLLAATIVRVTKELDKPWCISVFKDNSGVIDFDGINCVCFKVETHNHPSAVEPYGGAETGIGGVIRDPLGTGLGAKPVANTDVFCFAPPDMKEEDIPAGCLHPKHVMKGVVSGVRDYGNRMGIPTVNGAIYFDERFVGNPLVYCGNVGVIPRDKIDKAARAGDLVVVVGGRTGRDGIHGATLSSAELATGSDVIWSGAVQIGNPITEKKLVDTLLVARDRGLYGAITDCGAGGLSSAVGEMGSEIGAEVHLEKVPLKYEGLAPWEVWCSEAQERMVLAVSPEKYDELDALFASEDVEATAIGTFTGDGRLTLFYRGNKVADIDMEFLHDGVPRLERTATWKPPKLEEPVIEPKRDYTADLVALLSTPTISSKEWVIRQYDHEVQGTSAVKPLVGAKNDGPSDAAVLTPVLGSRRGIILSCGLNPRYSDIDPYHMAANAIDEALRQVIAVGGSLERTAILDNFCWGNTDKPDRLGGLVRAARACYDIAKVYETPFISGKDSLNNEFRACGLTVAIPGTLLISAISVMEDVTRAVTMDFKRAGDRIYVVGNTRDELGGSQFYALAGKTGRNVPVVDPLAGKDIFSALSGATKAGLVRACHDISDGGLAVAAAEMAFAGCLGAEIALDTVPAKSSLRAQALLFSETPSRFIVEVSPENAAAFEDALKGLPAACVGTVTAGTALTLTHEGEQVIGAAIDDLRAAWKLTLAY
jgi:phosphoribosylformylglycinamidine synthase